jgi:hypothetical protein
MASFANRFDNMANALSIVNPQLPQIQAQNEVPLSAIDTLSFCAVRCGLLYSAPVNSQMDISE